MPRQQLYDPKSSIKVRSQNGGLTAGLVDGAGGQSVHGGHSNELLAGAVVRVERMSAEQRLRLADEVHERQPYLLASVMVLHWHEATFQQIELVLDLLFVFHEAMKATEAQRPMISEDLQERCMRRVTARAQFNVGLTPEQQAEATAQAMNRHPGKLPLAYVYGKFKEHGLSAIETKAEKMMLLAALNMVECIAEAAPAMTLSDGS